jgi:hypothetical protein
VVLDVALSLPAVLISNLVQKNTNFYFFLIKLEVGRVGFQLIGILTSPLLQPQASHKT